MEQGVRVRRAKKSNRRRMVKRRITRAMPLPEAAEDGEAGGSTDITNIKQRKKRKLEDDVENGTQGEDLVQEQPTIP